MIKKIIYSIIGVFSILTISILYVSDNSNIKKRAYDKKQFDALSIAAPNIKLYEYLKRETKDSLLFMDNLRVANQESGFRGIYHYSYKPFADGTRVSYAGARGPMQVMPLTAKAYDKITNKELEYNIKKNVEISVKYQRDLLKDFSRIKAYSIYNQGWKGRKNINNYARKITNHN